MPLIAVAPRRSVHCHPMASFFPQPFSVSPRFPSPAPFLQGLSDSADILDNLFDQFAGAIPKRTYQPRFDVKEEKDAFHLLGEVPGVDLQNLQVEFIDRNTLSVRGKTVRETQRGQPPNASIQQSEPQKSIESETPVDQTAAVTSNETETSRASTPDSTSSHYRKASVEQVADDDNDFVDVQAEKAAESAPQPEDAQAVTKQAQDAPAPTKSEQTSHYWVSERTVGEFHRTFKFPGLVDQDNVSASLKDGILRVVVPKVAEQSPRRIAIQ